MIIDFFDTVYTYVSQIKYSFIRKGMRIAVRGVANLIMPIVYRSTSSFTLPAGFLEEENKESARIIVTLTSFPARINKLYLVCESLLRQTYKPDLIVIWLSKLQFPSLDNLPDKLLQLQQKGVCIKLVEEDIRSHKKYYYALQEFPNDNLLIVDDDILYRSKMIASLFSYHKKCPHAIIAQYGRKIERVNGIVKSYEKWKKIESDFSNVGPSDIFFGSGGGLFVPPHSFYKDVLNKDLFLSLTPYADDIWLNAMARLQGTQIIKTQYYSANLEIIYKKNTTLSTLNNDSSLNMNDVQMKKINEYYDKKLIW